LDRSGCNRLLLVKDRSCEELTWNDYKSAVFNSLGYEVSCKPPARVIRRYREELSQLRYPVKVMVDGVWTLPEYPGIVWEDGKYIDTSSPEKRQACGFKDDLYLCRRVGPPPHPHPPPTPLGSSTRKILGNKILVYTVTMTEPQKSKFVFRLEQGERN